MCDNLAPLCNDARVNESASAARTPGGPDPSTSRRILDATAEVLGRSGMSKLSLSEVALQAGVSRPTLYRWFSSKDELIEEFSRYEQELFDSGIARATAGLRGNERLDAALRFIVEFQSSYSGVRMVDIEPGQVLSRIALVLPVMRERLERMISGPDRAVAAATVTRVAVCHYIVRGEDADDFLAQLRHAAGLKPRAS